MDNAVNSGNFLFFLLRIMLRLFFFFFFWTCHHPVWTWMVKRSRTCALTTGMLGRLSHSPAAMLATVPTERWQLGGLEAIPVALWTRFQLRTTNNPFNTSDLCFFYYCLCEKIREKYKYLLERLLIMDDIRSIWWTDKALEQWSPSSGL